MNIVAQNAIVFIACGMTYNTKSDIQSIKGQLYFEMTQAAFILWLYKSLDIV